MNFVTANFRGQRVARCSWAAAGGCTLRAGVAAKGVCRWFVSEDEINSAVGFIAARRKRPRRKGTNVNKFKSDRSVGPTVSWKTPREFFIRPVRRCLHVFRKFPRTWCVRETQLYTRCEEELASCSISRLQLQIYVFRSLQSFVQPLWTLV